MAKLIKLEIVLMDNKLVIHIKYKVQEFSKIFRGLQVQAMEIGSKVEVKFQIINSTKAQQKVNKMKTNNHNKSI